MLLSLVLIRYLNSSLLGDLSLARTWQQLVDYSHLGARFSLDRYIPVSVSKEKHELLTTVLLATVFGGLLVLIASFIFSDRNVTVLILTISGLFIAIANVFKTYLRATNSIDEMLVLVFFSQFLPVVIPLVIYCVTRDFSWYLYSSLVTYLFAIIYVLLSKKKLIEVNNSATILKTYKKIALPSFYLFINSLFIFLYLVMDRFFIDYSSGRAMLGNYSVITFAFSALMIIPATCAELLYVRVIQQSSKNGKTLFLKETLLILLITILGVGVANLVMGYFITTFTVYASLLVDMHYATIAVIPFALTAIYYHVMNGLDLRKNMIMVNAFVCAILCIFYIIPIMTNSQESLRYYIYIKMGTGWLVFIGYVISILFYKRRIAINI
jgi:O-antigen/teichoic acid export membrane protein